MVGASEIAKSERRTQDLHRGDGCVSVLGAAVVSLPEVGEGGDRYIADG